MPSKFTLQELMLIINNRADIFEIRPMLDLFVKKIILFTSIDEVSASAVSVAKYVINTTDFKRLFCCHSSRNRRSSSINAVTV